MASEKGLVYLAKPENKRVEGERYPELEEALERYFSGDEVDFSHFPVDLSTLSPFQKRVLEEVRGIRWGEVKSYEEIGERLGDRRKARAVGQALARNPIPIIIPCHRVIRKDGGLGGFSWGLEWKRLLLKLEGCSAV
ncbi:methylated-DNA--[protein]-cysteine S-methyltransferase [bacterium]|nr:methylated-DNA--[protein]-cysteine S-methyltransferase [bacterium]